MKAEVRNLSKFFIKNNLDLLGIVDRAILKKIIS